jgi:hypothetical protein
MTETMNDILLYTTKGGEIAYGSIAECYEAEIEPHGGEITTPQTIEAYTSKLAVGGFPDRQELLDHITTLYAEDEESPDDDGATVEIIRGSEAVQVAIDALLDACKASVTYRWCSELVTSFTVTWDDQGEPLIDGALLYGRSADD